MHYIVSGKKKGLASFLAANGELKETTHKKTDIEAPDLVESSAGFDVADLVGIS